MQSHRRPRSRAAVSLLVVVKLRLPARIRVYTETLRVFGALNDVRATLYDVAMAGLDFADDGVLVKALAARDADAFAYLLDRYHGQLVRLASQYVPSRRSPKRSCRRRGSR